MHFDDVFLDDLRYDTQWGLLETKYCMAAVVMPFLDDESCETNMCLPVLPSKVGPMDRT